jgi:ABC-type lipoprotein release transport system permease subunit
MFRALVLTVLASSVVLAPTSRAARGESPAVLAQNAGTIGRTGDAPGNAPAVLISRQLAESRQLRVGDIVRLSAEASGDRSLPFRIAGVYEPTPDPMRFAQQSLDARLHLPDLLRLTANPSDPDASDAISSVNVALTQPAAAAAFARDLSARLPGTIARPTAAPDDRTTTFLVIERFHLAIAIVTMVGSAVFLLALMMMLVDERRETVGALRLIGLTRGRILLQVLVEGALIAAAGTACGILFALAAQGAINRFFEWRYDTALIFLRITPAVVAQSVALALPLGIVASLVASWAVLRRPLLSLLRR